MYDNYLYYKGRLYVTCKFQMMMLPSLQPEASQLPLCENCTNHTSSLCSLRVWTVSEGNWLLQKINMIQTQTNKNAYRHTQTYSESYTLTHSQTSTDTDTQTHRHAHTHRHTRRHTDTDTDTHTHRHTHTHTHTDWLGIWGSTKDVFNSQFCFGSQGQTIRVELSNDIKASKQIVNIHVLKVKMVKYTAFDQ